MPFVVAAAVVVVVVIVLVTINRRHDWAMDMNPILTKVFCFEI